jgi:hypothetical protein
MKEKASDDPNSESDLIGSLSFKDFFIRDHFVPGHLLHLDKRRTFNLLQLQLVVDETIDSLYPLFVIQ